MSRRESGSKTQPPQQRAPVFDEIVRPAVPHANVPAVPPTSVPVQNPVSGGMRRPSNSVIISESEQRQAVLREKIDKEMKIKKGTENMLEALLAKNPKHTKEQRLRVESELNSSQRKLVQLQRELEDELHKLQVGGYSRSPTSTTGIGLGYAPNFVPGGAGQIGSEAAGPANSRFSVLFKGVPPRSESRTMMSDRSGIDLTFTENESPTFVLSETLQALELAGMPPDYYVERANSLVELFK
ncbi:hypothetical protein KEM55_000123, partial [Ascosphaera atra]